MEGAANSSECIQDPVISCTVCQCTVLCSAWIVQDVFKSEWIRTCTNLPLCFGCLTVVIREVTLVKEGCQGVAYVQCTMG